VSGSSVAYGTNGSQEVGWFSISYSAFGHAVLWNGTAASAVDLHPTGFSWAVTSAALATNGAQQVAYGQGPNYAISRALAWSGTADSVVDLQELLPPGYTFSRAYSIDQSGNIFGIATAVDGTHAVEWVPVPEPASFVLLWIGAAGLLCWR